MKNKNKNKGSNPMSVMVVSVILTAMLASSGGIEEKIAAVVLLVGSIIAVVVSISQKAKRVGENAADTGRPEAVSKNEGAQQRYRSFVSAAKTETERALHYDESEKRATDKYAGYDHDTAHRLEQLDNFLKNGTIDKKEYNILRRRYTGDR